MDTAYNLNSADVPIWSSVLRGWWRSASTHRLLTAGLQAVDAVLTAMETGVPFPTRTIDTANAVETS